MAGFHKIKRNEISWAFGLLVVLLTQSHQEKADGVNNQTATRNLFAQRGVKYAHKKRIYNKIHLFNTLVMLNGCSLGELSYIYLGAVQGSQEE